ncbi:MAG: hypothetical protein QOG38_122 [Hyphomicrobiales bacterium]|nr:hypothetical protein [Hyphomicrobiales bacterium]
MRAHARFGYLLASFVVALVVSSFIEASAAPATCANVRCRAGTHCVDMPTGPKCVSNRTCASVRCRAGTHCVDMNTGPKCVSDLTCANVRCIGGTHCVETPNGPRCQRGPATPQPKY